MGSRRLWWKGSIWGGVCLNWGCIPTKSLLRNAEVVNLLTKGRAFGFSIEGLSVDYAEAQRRSRTVVAPDRALTPCDHAVSRSRNSVVTKIKDRGFLE